MSDDPTYLRGKIEEWKRISDADDARIARLSAQRDIAIGIALALFTILAVLTMGAAR